MCIRDRETWDGHDTVAPALWFAFDFAPLPVSSDRLRYRYTHPCEVKVADAKSQGFVGPQACICEEEDEQLSLIHI